MKVTMVGTSCTWYSKNNTSFIIDDNMLFDISSGNYKDVIKSLDIFDLNAIFISHLHADHVGDLYVITTRYIRELKKRDKKEKLRIYGPKGLAEFIVDYCRLCFGSADELDLNLLKNTIDFIEVYDGFVFEEGEYKIKALKMLHGNMDCYGYMFDDKKGKVISFSADTSKCDNLLQMLNNSNYAFVDMAAVSENIHHLHVDGFISLENTYKNCKMIPVHISDQAYELAKSYNMELHNDGDIIYL